MNSFPEGDLANWSRRGGHPRELTYENESHERKVRSLAKKTLGSCAFE